MAIAKNLAKLLAVNIEELLSVSLDRCEAEELEKSSVIRTTDRKIEIAGKLEKLEKRCEWAMAHSVQDLEQEALDAVDDMLGRYRTITELPVAVNLELVSDLVSGIYSLADSVYHARIRTFKDSCSPEFIQLLNSDYISDREKVRDAFKNYLVSNTSEIEKDSKLITAAAGFLSGISGLAPLQVCRLTQVIQSLTSRIFLPNEPYSYFERFDAASSHEQISELIGVFKEYSLSQPDALPLLADVLDNGYAVKGFSDVFKAYKDKPGLREAAVILTSWAYHNPASFGYFTRTLAAQKAGLYEMSAALNSPSVLDQVHSPDAMNKVDNIKNEIVSMFLDKKISGTLDEFSSGRIVKLECFVIPIIEGIMNKSVVEAITKEYETVLKPARQMGLWRIVLKHAAAKDDQIRGLVDEFIKNYELLINKHASSKPDDRTSFQHEWILDDENLRDAASRYKILACAILKYNALHDNRRLNSGIEFIKKGWKDPESPIKMRKNSIIKSLTELCKDPRASYGTWRAYQLAGI